MYDHLGVEFPKVLFLDHYSFPFTSVTSIYLSKQVVNVWKMTLLHRLDTVLCFACVVIDIVLSLRLTCLFSVGLFRFAFFRSIYHAYIVARRVVFTELSFCFICWYIGTTTIFCKDGCVLLLLLLCFNKVSKLLFYAQSTGTVISGEFQQGQMIQSLYLSNKVQSNNHLIIQ